MTFDRKRPSFAKGVKDGAPSSTFALWRRWERHGSEDPPVP